MLPGTKMTWSPVSFLVLALLSGSGVYSGTSFSDSCTSGSVKLSTLSGGSYTSIVCVSASFYDMYWRALSLCVKSSTVSGAGSLTGSSLKITSWCGVLNKIGVYWQLRSGRGIWIVITFASGGKLSNDSLSLTSAQDNSAELLCFCFMQFPI